MKTKNVKKIHLKVPVIVMSVLSAVVFVGGGLYAYFGEGSFVAENSKVLTVTDTKSIEERGKNIANDSIALANDIHITDASFCIGDSVAFSGVFDGCGHTVYLDYQVGTADTSLFSSIAKDGLVKNTRFVFTNVAVEGQSFSGVAKINYGTVQDCAVEYNLQFSAKEGMFTPFIAINYGVVKSIVVNGTIFYNSQPVTSISDYETDGSLTLPERPEETEETENPETSEVITSIHSDIKNEDERKIAFAGACVYNYGELKNVLSTPRFVGFYCTNRENYLAGRSENVAIASVCSFSGGEVYDGKTPSESGLVSICEKTLYTSDDVRVDKYEDFASLIFDANGALTKTIIENTYDFNNTVWEIDENELCLKLKVIG